MSDAAPNLQDWIGRRETATDLLRPQPARFMQATLDRDATLTDGDALPPLWHWLYFLDARPASELGRDAHPRKGGFLPPVDLPRRMWAGGRFRFHAPLILGQPASRQSTIRSVSQKQGRSGRLCFVTVIHELFQNGTCALHEEHDIVYRQDPSPDAPHPIPAAAPEGAEVTRPVVPTQVMLFRYSALTFNGHRIHYDLDYARDVEGYRGLVVHGPLLAQLLMLMATDILGPLATFSFRAYSPLMHFETAELCHKDGALWVRGPDGRQCMTAEATASE